MKRSLPFIAGAAVLLLLVILSATGKKPPLIPADKTHSAAISDESCGPCHGPGMPSPLKAIHPPKEQCVHCHQRSR